MESQRNPPNYLYNRGVAVLTLHDGIDAQRDYAELHQTPFQPWSHFGDYRHNYQKVVPYDVEGEGEKATLGWVLFSCREDELYEVTGMETELMLPHGTTAKAGPWDGITTEINHRHVRSYLAGDPNMKGWRRGRRVGSARGPLEMPLSGGEANGAG